MNTFHQEPRFDCVNFAPCGIHSLSKCRRYKGKMEECQGCALVRRKSKTLNHVEPDKKVCPHCGKELNITMFGIRKVYRNDKEYHCRASWCKICTSKVNNQRHRRKAKERFKTKMNYEKV